MTLNIPDIEKRTVYMSLGEAQDLYGLAEQSTEVGVILKQLGQEAAVIAALKPDCLVTRLSSWETNYPELTTAISSKGAAMNVMSVVIMLIAGIGILNLLLMAVYERSREIGVLGALGFRPRQISWLFILEGTLIGLVGVGAGIVMGLALNGLLRLFRPGFHRLLESHQLHGADQREGLSQLGYGKAGQSSS